MQTREPTRSVCPSCRAIFRSGFDRCPRDGVRLDVAFADPLVGMVLADRYRVERLIGEGGIGRVYGCRHLHLSRRFAVKVPFGEFAFDAKARIRLANEAEAASRLQHRNLVSVVDAGETEGGLFFLAMDLAEGEDLGTVIARGAMPERRALRLAAEIADGLAHAHGRGLIHRDLKPDNVVLTIDDDGEERPRIVDFGLALPTERKRRLTTEGIVIGTPRYMSPEQCRGDDLDLRTDLYSLGMMLFEMLAGVPPRDGTAVELARAALAEPLPPIASRNPAANVTPAVEGLIRWLTEKKPERRPGDAGVVGETLRLTLARGELATAETQRNPTLSTTKKVRRPAAGWRRWFPWPRIE